MRFVRVAAAADLAEGAMKVVVADDRNIVLVNLDGEFYALDNQCPHLGGPLGQGVIQCGTIVCPWHGWQWDARSGRNVWPEVGWRAFRYEVKVEAGQVLVRVG